MKTIKITMATLLLLLAYSFVAEDTEASQSIYAGLYTQHYLSSGEYNEDNRVIQYQYNDEGVFYSAATFNNSHSIRSYQGGVGRYWQSGQSELGAAISLIYGYKGHIRTIGHGLIVAPGVYYEHKLNSAIGVKMIVMPAVYNVGLNYAF